MNLSESKKVLDLMRQRASCRNFSDMEIPKDLLDDIIKTGLCAASGGNLQPFSIIVITDNDEKEKITEVCGRQKFMTQAPVNLLFVLDWHKMSLFAEHEKAPFTCPDSYMHFVIGLEDVVCAAQSIETAAWLSGIGSCYVGTTNHVGSKLIEMYNLPKYTYPVLLLSLGYPKADLTVAPKLSYDAMVFEGKYPDLSNAENKKSIIDAYTEKYKNRFMDLPSNEEFRENMLKRLKEAFLTTYSTEETDELIEKIVADGRMNETQRRFGLHYHAAGMRVLGREILEMMKNNGFTFFD